jgi:hypothetical protein
MRQVNACLPFAAPQEPHRAIDADIACRKGTVAFCNGCTGRTSSLGSKIAMAMDHTSDRRYGIPFALCANTPVANEGVSQMTAMIDKQIVHELAWELSQASDGRARIETERRTVVGREVVELRVFLLQAPSQMPADQWVGLYCDRFARILHSAGLELAADEWFTPSQRFPSCSCWIERSTSPHSGSRMNAL